MRGGVGGGGDVPQHSETDTGRSAYGLPERFDAIWIPEAWKLIHRWRDGRGGGTTSDAATR